MVSPESPELLGTASPAVFFSVVGTALVLMFALVLSCWMV